MKLYFQDLNPEAQEKVFREAREHLGFDTPCEEGEPSEDEKEKMDEEIDDYLNRNNFGVEFPMTEAERE